MRLLGQHFYALFSSEVMQLLVDCVMLTVQKTYLLLLCRWPLLRVTYWEITSYTLFELLIASYRNARKRDFFFSIHCSLSKMFLYMEFSCVRSLSLLLPGTELPLAESFALLNDLFPFPSILDTGYPVFYLHLANVLFDVILPSVLGSSSGSFS